MREEQDDSFMDCRNSLWLDRTTLYSNGNHGKKVREDVRMEQNVILVSQETAIIGFAVTSCVIIVIWVITLIYEFFNSLDEGGIDDGT